MKNTRTRFALSIGILAALAWANAAPAHAQCPTPQAFAPLGGTYTYASWFQDGDVFDFDSIGPQPQRIFLWNSNNRSIFEYNIQTGQTLPLALPSFNFTIEPAAFQKIDPDGPGPLGDRILSANYQIFDGTSWTLLPTNLNTGETFLDPNNPQYFIIPWDFDGPGPSQPLLWAVRKSDGQTAYLFDNKWWLDASLNVTFCSDNCNLPPFIVDVDGPGPLNPTLVYRDKQRNVSTSITSSSFVSLPFSNSVIYSFSRNPALPPEIYQARLTQNLTQFFRFNPNAGIDFPLWTPLGSTPKLVSTGTLPRFYEVQTPSGPALYCQSYGEVLLVDANGNTPQTLTASPSLSLAVLRNGAPLNITFTNTYITRSDGQFEGSFPSVPNGISSSGIFLISDPDGTGPLPSGPTFFFDNNRFTSAPGFSFFNGNRWNNSAQTPLPDFLGTSLGLLTWQGAPTAGGVGGDGNRAYHLTATGWVQLPQIPGNSSNSFRYKTAWDPDGPGPLPEFLVAENYTDPNGLSILPSPTATWTNISIPTTPSTSTWRPFVMGTYDPDGPGPQLRKLVLTGQRVRTSDNAQRGYIALYDYVTGFSHLLDGLDDVNFPGSKALELDPDGPGPQPNLLYLVTRSTQATVVANLQQIPHLNLLQYDGTTFSSPAVNLPYGQVIQSSTAVVADLDGSGPLPKRLIANGAQLIGNLWVPLENFPSELFLPNNTVAWDPDGPGPKGDAIVAVPLITVIDSQPAIGLLAYGCPFTFPLVACKADLGSQGGSLGPDNALNNNDFVAFINLFFLQDPRADLGSQGGIVGPDTLLNNNDFAAFLTLFFSGC